jgi:nucleotide-binding universal stress UspA family protein
VTAPVIVGYDGRDPSHDALALAGALAQGVRPLVAAWISEPDALSSATDTQATRKRHLDLDSLRSEILARRPPPNGSPHTEVVLMGGLSPAAGLHDLADDRRGTVIVVGSTHHGSLGRAVPGSTSGRLLHDGRHPVAVAPRGWAVGAHPIRAIAVGFDGTPASVVALNWARDLASELGAGLVALTAGDPAASHLDSLTPPNGDAIERVTLEGPAAEALARAAKDFDLLVIGSRRGRHLFGSVSHDLDHHCPVPLVVAPEVVGSASATRLSGSG